MPHSTFKDVATPFEGQPCNCHGLSGNGMDDLSMKFRTAQVVAALQLNDLNGEYIRMMSVEQLESLLEWALWG